MKKLIPLILAATVGIIVIAGVLMPVLNDAASNTDTYKNDSYYTLDQITPDTNRVITWSKATPDKITIDGTDFIMSFAEINRSYTLVGSDSLVLRYQIDSNVTGIQMYSGTSGATYVSFHTNTDPSVGDMITITVTGSTVTTKTNGSSATEFTANVGSDGYIINSTGQGSYAMKDADSSAYILKSSPIRFIGVSVNAGPNGIALYGSGTLEGGMTLSTIYKPSNVTTVSYTDPIPTDTEVSSHVNLYTLEKYVFTITYDSNTYDATYSYFIVPVTVTADKTDSAPLADYGGLVMAIPVILITALVAMVAMVISRRE